MWPHKPHTETKKITLSRNRNSDIPHGNMNKLNRSHLRINKHLNYYKPHNKRETNQYGNRRIDNSPAWKKKKEGQLKEDSSTKYPLLVIPVRMFK